MVNLIWSAQVSIKVESYNHYGQTLMESLKFSRLGDAKCTNRGHPLFDTGYGTCIAQDGNGALRSNFGVLRMLDLS